MLITKNKNLYFYTLLALIIILADRLTKSWALQLVGEKIVNPFLSFGLTFNRGINWGILNSKSAALFIFINIVIALVIIEQFHQKRFSSLFCVFSLSILSISTILRAG